MSVQSQSPFATNVFLLFESGLREQPRELAHANERGQKEINALSDSGAGDHYSANQQPVPTEGVFTLDSEHGVEATIALLKRHCEVIRQREVKHVRGRLGHLDSAQENAIESLTLAIIDHILDAPVRVLQAAFEDRDSRAVIESVHHIFSLDEWRPV